MAIKVNASVEELRRFSDSVKYFNDKIDACIRQLQLDTTQLRDNLDERTILPMEAAVTKINRIISDAAPQLNTLITMINLYADALAEAEARIAAAKI